MTDRAVQPTSIDGVLLRSATPIPGASRSLTYLQRHDVPFLLLTNGGGKHESERVAEISRALALTTPLTSANLLQSHTPIADFLPSGFPHHHHPAGPALAADATVLVVGGEADRCRLVAERYGFQTVVTPGDLLAAHPDMWPSSGVFLDGYYSRFARPLPRAVDPSSSGGLKIDAILVFHDPRDWGLDLQVIVDVLLSEGGVVGTVSGRNGDSSLPNCGYQQHGQPPLYFSNPDLVWAAGWHLPRLGQGGFIHALEGVWRRLTRGAAELRCTVLGKPSALTYAVAENRLRAFRRDLLRRTHPDDDASSPVPELRKVYMVGDNPESDIQGANSHRSTHGTEWLSVLVQTGVFKAGQQRDAPLPPELRPRVVVDDVGAAVDWALADAGWHGHVD